MSQSSVIDRLVQNVSAAVQGKPDQVRLAVACLLADGHLLLDDAPGTGKTTLAKAMANSISGDWKRVQFTPDLLPSDVSGVMVYDQRTSMFHFREGPVFTNVLIGDEINRGSPKTQAALLEVMEERQVTSDGVSRAVPSPFFVIATQNPLDSQGTFPLPDVQLDRFTMRISLGYAHPEVETEILDSVSSSEPRHEIAAVTTTGEVEHLIARIKAIDVAESVNRYIVGIANATRHHPDLRQGVSTRATISMARAARAVAAIDGRAYVTPDDVKSIVAPVFGHRVQLTSEADFRGVTTDTVLAEVLDEVPVPRSGAVVDAPPSMPIQPAPPLSVPSPTGPGHPTL